MNVWKRSVLMAVALSLVWTGLLLAADPAKTGVTGKPGLDRLKTLAGEWRGTVEERGKGPEVTVIYRVTANGSTVVETLFPGTDHEMITMYHLDRGNLVLTHYCAMGNQPRMKLGAQSTPDKFVFEFDGGSNLDASKDMHMHAGRIRFEGADTISSEWDVYKDGKSVGTNRFFLNRKR